MEVCHSKPMLVHRDSGLCRDDGRRGRFGLKGDVFFAEYETTTIYQIEIRDMTIWYNHVRTRIDLGILENNFRLIAAKAPCPVPVVKSDAYGHGIGPVASLLARCGASIMAVGTVGEGVALRLVPFEGKILSLLGPLLPEEYPLLWEYDIMPFVCREEQLRQIEQEGRLQGRPLDVALALDTGMGRIGFAPQEIGKVRSWLQDAEYVRVHMVCSHLATADEPQSRDFVLHQGEMFTRMCDELAETGLAFKRCLANSAAIQAYPELGFDLQRPGITLYGSNPFAGTEWEDTGEGLGPAMEVSTRIIAVHDLAKGAPISYGRTFYAPQDMRVAIVAVGYADNYSRGLSNRGEMVVHGQRVPIVGRVCMQMTAVDITRIPSVVPGDQVFLLGGQGGHPITPEDLAGWWGTIPYEVFCLLGQNEREYVSG
jgi:alanine racemase